MAKLLDAQSQTIATLEIARNAWSRMRGLLGRDRLDEDHGLWILKCNSIHTFFMKFAIDVVFVDRQQVVRKTIRGVKPGRVVLPVWRANSVIEFAEGFLLKHPLKVGEKLNVDHPIS